MENSNETTTVINTIIAIIAAIAPILATVLTVLITYQTTKHRFKNEQSYDYHKKVFKNLISKLYKKLYNLDISTYDFQKCTNLYKELQSLFVSQVIFSNPVLDRLMQDLQNSIEAKEGYENAFNKLRSYVIGENYRLKKYLGYPSPPLKDNFHFTKTFIEKVYIMVLILAVPLYVDIIIILIAIAYQKVKLIIISTFILFMIMVIILSLCVLSMAYMIVQHCRKKKAAKKKMKK